jgi:hypothetical protein
MQSASEGYFLLGCMDSNVVSDQLTAPLLAMSELEMLVSM